MRTHYKMFEPQFHLDVGSGKKRQTIRPIPKRERDIPTVGDRIVCRAWLGAPYRSKVRELIQGRVTASGPCGIGDHFAVKLDELLAEQPALDEFARADGFENWQEMAAWFNSRHGLPFTGILIQWEPIFQP